MKSLIRRAAILILVPLTSLIAQSPQGKYKFGPQQGDTEQCIVSQTDKKLPFEVIFVHVKPPKNSENFLHKSADSDGDVMFYVSDNTRVTISPDGQTVIAGAENATPEAVKTMQGDAPWLAAACQKRIAEEIKKQPRKKAAANGGPGF